MSNSWEGDKKLQDDSYSRKDTILGMIIWVSIGISIIGLMFLVFTTPIPVPAEKHIDEGCYVYKSSLFIRVDYLDGCEEEIAKMYDYGYTNVAFGSDHVNGEDLLMFKERS